MSSKPNYHYAAFAPCGCLVGLCIDFADRDTAKSVYDWIKGGCYVERHHRDELPVMLEKGLGCSCEPVQPGLFEVRA